MIEALASIPATEQAPASVAAARVILLHDLAVATSALSVTSGLLPAPVESGAYVDLASGGTVDLMSAVARNGQLIHALTQDETLLPAMTHVGATSLPLLIATAQRVDATVDDLICGLAAAFSAAEVVGRPIAGLLSRRGVRPTCVVGPIAAAVGVAAMLGWSESATAAAAARAAGVSFGTSQPWVEGTSDWMFHPAAAGAIALLAVQAGRETWVATTDPFFGKAGSLTALGISLDDVDQHPVDPTSSATRASLKRFPACACNQVPMVMALEHRDQLIESDAPLTVRMNPDEASYPGLDRTTSLDRWSARLMSLPYCLTVAIHTGSFEVDHLLTQPESLDAAEFERVTVVGDPLHPIGTYELVLGDPDHPDLHAIATLDDIGLPLPSELALAATAATDDVFMRRVTALTHATSTSVTDFALEFARYSKADS